MKYYLRLNYDKKVIEVDATPFKEDDRLFYVNVNKLDKPFPTKTPHQLIDIQTGIMVMCATSKEKVIAKYHEKLDTYNKLKENQSAYLNKLHRELNEIISTFKKSH